MRVGYRCRRQHRKLRNEIVRGGDIADIKCILKRRTDPQTREHLNLVAEFGAPHVFKTCPVIFITSVDEKRRRSGERTELTLSGEAPGAGGLRYLQELRQSGPSSSRPAPSPEHHAVPGPLPGAALRPLPAGLPTRHCPRPGPARRLPLPFPSRSLLPPAPAVPASLPAPRPG